MRDIAALEQADVPVWSVDGRGGVYRLMRTAALPPLAFTVGEATAVAVALATEPGLPFGPDGHTALAKVLGAMDDRHRRRTAELAEHIWILAPADDNRSRAARIVDEALRESVIVNLDYQDAHGRRSESRLVEPLALARTGGRWYLLGWCGHRLSGRLVPDGPHP